MTSEKNSAIILAAGQSSRMHAFKPLLPLGRLTVIERAINLFKSGGIENVLAVIGHRASELVPLLARWDVAYVVNESHHEGMFSSVACGVRNLGPNPQAFFVLPVDIPLVRRQTILELLSVFRTGGKSIVYPTFQGRRGHPPLIAFHLAAEIMVWNGEGGLRALLAQHEPDSLEVEVADEGVLLDLDTSSDYKSLYERCLRLDVPTEKECEVVLQKTLGDRDDVAAHCRQVNRVALRLVSALQEKGVNLERDLVQAGALLHDIARGQARHAAVGAEVLRAMDYPRVANIVASHMDLGTPTGDITPGAIVYLADKLVEEDRCVSLKERFGKKMIRFGADPDACGRIERRLQDALSVQRNIELKVGRSIDDLLSEL